MSEEDKKKIQQALENNMIKENKQKVAEKKIKEIIDDAKTNIKNEKDDKIEWKPISEFKDEMEKIFNNNELGKFFNTFMNYLSLRNVQYNTKMKDTLVNGLENICKSAKGNNNITNSSGDNVNTIVPKIDTNTFF